MLVFLHATRCGSVIFGSVFSTMLQGKHLQIFDEVKALKLIMFFNLKFSITQYVFLIFKVSVTQSATWVIFTELILTSLSQILILISSTIVLFS